MPKRSLLQILARFLLVPAVLGFASCASVISPQTAAIRIAGVKKQPISLTVTDRRTEISGGSRSYYGRCRIAYGIPTPIFDPDFTMSARLSRQIKAGLEQDGFSVAIVDDNGVCESPLSTRDKSLTLELKNIWIDFAAPIGNGDSILYFEVTARVFGPGPGASRVVVSRNYEKRFHYNKGDTRLNQGIWVLQAEFTQLLNDPEIRRALSK